MTNATSGPAHDSSTGEVVESPATQIAPEPQIRNQQFQYPAPTQPTFAAPMSPPRAKSITSMWIGIASLIFGMLIVLPIVGLVLGIVGWKSEPAGKGAAIAGVILNSVVLLFWALMAALALVGYVLLGTAGGFLF